MIEISRCTANISMERDVAVVDCEMLVRASPAWREVGTLHLDLRGLPLAFSHASSSVSQETFSSGRFEVLPLEAGRTWHDARVRFRLTDLKARGVSGERRLLCFPEHVPVLEETRELVEAGEQARMSEWQIAVDELVQSATILRLQGPGGAHPEAPATVSAVVALHFQQCSPRVHASPAITADPELAIGLQMLCYDIERLLDALADLTTMPVNRDGVVVALGNELPARGTLSPLVLSFDKETIGSYATLQPGQRFWLTSNLGALVWRGCCSLNGWRAREISWGLSQGCALAAFSTIDASGARFVHEHLRRRARWRLQSLFSTEVRTERRYAGIACRVFRYLASDAGRHEVRFALGVLHGKVASTSYVSDLLPELKLLTGI